MIGSPVASDVMENARLVRAVCAQIDDVADFVRRMAEPEWLGVAADAYRARAAAIGRCADAHSLTIRGAASALDRYAARVAAGEDPGLAELDLRGELRRLWPTGGAGWRSMLGQVDPADEALRRCPRDRAAPDVKRWWAAMSDGEREAVLVAAPGLIGGLDGLPAAARSIANRVALTRDLVAGRWRRHHGVLTAEERLALHSAEEADSALTDLEHRDLATQLYLYDPDAFGGDGRVAIAAGELDDADHIALIVPGLGNDASDVRIVAERAGNLAEAAVSATPDATTTVLAWIGYDAPDNLAPWGSDRDALTVTTVTAAESGGDRIGELVGGLRATDTGERMHMTLIGHSYGSTAVGQGVHDHLLAVDDLVVVGSPGLGRGIDHAGDLGLGPEHVWVGANSRDPVAELGDIGWVNPGRIGLGLGANPASEEFAAQRFEAETVDHWGGLPSPIEAHTTYFDHNTESLWNLGHIVTGHGEDVRIAQPVTDSWRSDPVDPEAARGPTSPSTR